MELVFVGLGRMGANMARGLIKDGHKIVATTSTRTRSRRWASEGAEAR